MFHPRISSERAERVVKASPAFGEGRKFDAADMRPALVEAAVRLLEDYTGDFDFLLGMHSRLHEECNLTDGQWAGVLNCFRKHLSGSGLFRTVLPNGYYTVVEPIVKPHLTIRIADHWDKESATKGEQVAYFLNGPCNTSDYKGFGFVKGDRYTPWNRFRGNERFDKAMRYLLDEGWRVAGVAYAFESGNCCFCNRTLTTEESKVAGYGPDCAKRHGLPWGQKRT